MADIHPHELLAPAIGVAIIIVLAVIGVLFVATFGPILLGWLFGGIPGS